MKCEHKNHAIDEANNQLICSDCGAICDRAYGVWSSATKCSHMQAMHYSDIRIDTCPDCGATRQFGGHWMPECKHLNYRTFGEEDVCKDCGMKRPHNSDTWKYIVFNCSTCGEEFNYVGRFPLPDFHQANCPTCIGKIASRIMSTVPSWIDWAFSLCDAIATKSKDQSTKLGCIILGPGHEMRSMGYNSFPRGCNDYVPERQERPIKYRYFAHAEENAICNAARMGVSLEGCTLYCQWPPCDRCARMIIGAGIRMVICRDCKVPDRRVEEVIAALEMITESGVQMSGARGMLEELRSR